MNSDDTETLVIKAFVLEVLADKPGCTTRHTDLPGKPLEDFIIAGINAGPFFKTFSVERLGGDTSLYKHFLPALEASNLHKSDKYINLGLLEIMFNVVAARLNNDRPDQVIAQINKELTSAPAADVERLVSVRELAWSTSKNQQKRGIVKKMKTAKAKSPYEFKEWLVKSTPPGSASFQWGAQAISGWPVLSELFDGIRESKKESLLEKISEAYTPVAASNKDLKVGILADMTAAAIFLHLSFL